MGGIANMRLVSPFMETVSSLVGRAVDDFVQPVPRSVRAAAAMERGMPGLDSDPVFIIPGLTADRWMYRRAKDMLEAEGFVVGGMKMPWHGWAGIPGDGRKVAAGVEHLIEKARRRGRDVDSAILVGDSEGGLIARWSLQFEGGKPLVSRLVTNGTPHNGIRPLGSELAASIAQRMLLPAGVKDLLVSSPVMHQLNDDWLHFLRRARTADPSFEAHSIASNFLGMRHDGLVPERAARLAGDPSIVRNYVTDGAHSINFAYGRRQAEAGEVLLAALGSKEPAALAAAERAYARAQSRPGVAQAAEGAREIGR